MDWWFHLGLTLHLPTDVDLETGIRWIRPRHCPPQMLLNAQWESENWGLLRSNPPFAMYCICFILILYFKINYVCKYFYKNKNVARTTALDIPKKTLITIMIMMMIGIWKLQKNNGKYDYMRENNQREKTLHWKSHERNKQIIEKYIYKPTILLKSTNT